MINKSGKNIYPRNPEMRGTYTVKTSFYPDSKVVINSLYIGNKADEKNEIEVMSKLTLDKRILNVMDDQADKLSKDSKLNPIVETLTL
jgi:hypothetical protein